LTNLRPHRVVRLSLLEYDEKFIPIPLFATSIGLLTGFTYIFPFLGFLTLPAAIFVIFSILTEDITFVNSKEAKSKLSDEEE
jgi:hypothetical protein